MISHGRFKVKNNKIVNFTVFDDYDNRLDYYDKNLELNYNHVKSYECDRLIPFTMKELKKHIPLNFIDGIIEF